MIAIPKCLGDCPHLRLRFKASISCPDRGLSPGSCPKASIARWDRGLSPGPSDSKASISCRATDPCGVCPHLHRNASVPSDATRGLSPGPSDSKASIARWDRDCPWVPQIQKLALLAEIGDCPRFPQIQKLALLAGIGDCPRVPQIQKLAFLAERRIRVGSVPQVP
jgi:hypothetical protein